MDKLDSWADYTPQRRAERSEQVRARRFQVGINGLMARLRERIDYASEQQLDELQAMVEQQRQSRVFTTAAGGDAA